MTTPLELEAYEIVKKIAGELVEPDRVTLRDVASYCSITLDNNSRQPLCRLIFDRPRKQVGFFDGSRSDNGTLVAAWTSIETVSEIYNHADHIKETVRRYVGLASD